MMKTRIILVVSLLAILSGMIFYEQSTKKADLIFVQGVTMGVIDYNVKYIGSDNPQVKKDIDSLLNTFNQSLSTYIPDSEISQLNATGLLSNASTMFQDVMTSSLIAWEQSGGAFDPTIGPLVNLWGFGPDKIIKDVDSTQVKNLMKYVGFNQIKSKNGSYSMDTDMFIDFSAVAKGYAVDLVSEFLEMRNVHNYMVEIGGEVRTKGTNLNKMVWRIGIENPLVNKDEQALFAVVEMGELSMATSGNYRNYYVRNGRLVAHTIDPRTGFNTTHSLLSATVFAKNCTDADAYATACMVLGLDGSIELAERANLSLFLIFNNEEGELSMYVSEQMNNKITINKAKDS